MPQFNEAQFNAGSASGTSATLLKDILYRAMRVAGITGAPGRTPSDDQFSDALATLNAMLGNWNANRLALHGALVKTWTLEPGKGQYTIGSGGDFDGARPEKIVGANILYENRRYGMRPVYDEGEWQRIAVTDAAGIPARLWDDDDYPLATLSLWPTPDLAYTLELYTWRVLSKFETVDDAFVLPDPYEEAIVYNLADRLCGMFQDPAGRRLQLSAQDLLRARKSLADLEAHNAPSPLMTPDAAVMPRRGGYDILTNTTR